MRSTRSIEILCLALAALVLIWLRPAPGDVAPLLALIGAYAGAVVLFRLRFVLPGRPGLVLRSWTMMAFIAGLSWFTGRGASPLTNLYLLPILFSAFTLGRATTLLQAGFAILIHAMLVVATPGLDPASLAVASRAVAQFAPILLVAYLTSTLSADVTEAREKIENLAQTDALTGLGNVRAFNETWQREHAACEAAGGSYALLMIDVDKLRAVNEAHGHEAGDRALLLVAQCLKRSIRNSDHAARFGGDEFTVLLPRATAEIAEAVVARIRNNVYKTTLDLGSRMIRCNVGVGVANFPKDGRDLREMLSAAEHQMYRDKELRRPPGARANP